MYVTLSQLIDLFNLWTRNPKLKALEKVVATALPLVVTIGFFNPKMLSLHFTFSPNP